MDIPKEIVFGIKAGYQEVCKSPAGQSITWQRKRIEEGFSHLCICAPECRNGYSPGTKNGRVNRWKFMLPDKAATIPECRVVVS